MWSFDGNATPGEVVSPLHFGGQPLMADGGVETPRASGVETPRICGVETPGRDGHVETPRVDPQSSPAPLPPPPSPPPEHSDMVAGDVLASHSQSVEGAVGPAMGALRGARELMWAEGVWGAFRITWIVPRDAAHPRNPEHGAWQGSCPFHRRNDVTACKKAISCNGPTIHDQEVALLRVKLWCNNAKRFLRQHSHLSNHPTTEEVMRHMDIVRALVETHRIDECPPAGTVRTDVELNDEAASVRQQRKRKRRSRAQGSGAVAVLDDPAAVAEPSGSAVASPHDSDEGPPVHVSNSSDSSSSSSSNSGSSNSSSDSSDSDSD